MVPQVGAPLLHLAEVVLHCRELGFEALECLSNSQESDPSPDLPAEESGVSRKPRAWLKRSQVPGRAVRQLLEAESISCGRSGPR